MPPRVVAVTVTYAERSALFARTVGAALSAGADEVILVLNGCGPLVSSEAERLRAELNDRLLLVRLPENGGSATGFAAGLRAALRREAEFIWLLDDDNEAAPEALKRLLEVVAEIETEVQGRLFALVSYRPDRGYQRAIVAGGRVSDVFPRASSFLSFSVVGWLRREVGVRWRRGRGETRRTVPIPYGPYGGLFAPARVIAAIGEPDTNFVLYEDDAEYTNRIVRQGGSLRLVPESEVRDIDDNWLSQSGGGRGPVRLLNAESTLRLYYSVRNRVYFESRFWRASRIAYGVNKWTYLALLRLLANSERKRGNLQVIRQAVAEGEHARLGIAPDGLRA